MARNIFKFLALAFTCTVLSSFAVACGGEDFGNSSSSTSTDSSIEEVLSSDISIEESTPSDSSVEDGSTDVTDSSSDSSAESADSSSETPAEPVVSGLSFKTLTVNGTDVSGRVNNATEEFSFVNEIHADGVSKYVVSLDPYGLTPLVAKAIPLGLGDNTAYIIETINDEPVNTFTVTIYRRSMFTVSFNTQGGTTITSQQIEEDSLAQQPDQPTREGYTFADWNFDFSKPIKQSVTVKPSWTANTNTAYTVEYYWQNIEDDNYPATPHETVKTSGTTGAQISATIKTYPHFTHKPTSSTSGTIAPDGSTVLKVYYTRDTYTVTFDGNGGTLASGTASQMVKYGGSVTAPTYEKVGHTFDGFDKTDYTNISESFTVTAQWKINQYTIRFILGNGYPDEVVTQDYNTPITIPTVERDGYILSWAQTVPTVMPAEDREIVAKWLSIFYRNGSTITGLTTDGKKLENLKIPAQIDGVNITSISNNAFKNCSNLTYVEISDGITTIGASAFEECYNMTNVIIPNTVTTVDTRAFVSCSNLQGNKKDNLIYLGNMENLYLYLTATTSSDITSANIENGCKFIGSYAFQSCKELTNVSIPNSVTSIGNYAFDTCVVLQDAEIPNSVTFIGTSAFHACNQLPTIKIPDSVTTIEDYAFSYCKSATSLQLSNNITTIAPFSFEACTSLTSLNIPENVTIIDKGAFYNCVGLVNVEIPNSVNTIGKHAFWNCSSLTSIVIPISVTSIGYCAFGQCNNSTAYCYASSKPSGWDSVWGIHKVIWGVEKFGSTDNGISWIQTSTDTINHYMHIIGYTGNETRVIIPETIDTYPVIEIRPYTFADCTSIENIEIPQGINAIGDYTFSGCTNLKSIAIPPSIDTIAPYTFQNCSNLVSVTLHNNFLTISSYAFYGCTSLSDITFPVAMNTIGDYAFANCSSLTELIIYKNVSSVGSNAFLGCSNLTIFCEKELPSGFASDWNPSNCHVEWGSTGEIYVRGVTSDGFVWKQMSDNTICITGYTGTSSDLVFPSTANNLPVTSILASAFSHTYITSVILPDTMTTINAKAFYACHKLTTVVIPSSVTTIDSSAFAWIYLRDSTITIYCEAQSKPSGWATDWYQKCTVVWGHTYTRYDITNGGNYYSTNTNLNFQFISNGNTVDLGYTDWTAPDTDCDNFKQYILYNGEALPSSAVVQGFNQKDGLALSGFTLKVGDTITIKKGSLFMRGSVIVMVFDVTLTWTYNGGNSFTCTVTP